MKTAEPSNAVAVARLPAWGCRCCAVLWRALCFGVFYTPVAAAALLAVGLFSATAVSSIRCDAVPLAAFVTAWPGDSYGLVLMELLIPLMLLLWAGIGCGMGWLCRIRALVESSLMRRGILVRMPREGVRGWRHWRKEESRLNRLLKRIGIPLVCAMVFLRLAVVRSNVDRPPDNYDYAPYAAMLGHVPWSDANGYYRGAQQLNTFGKLDLWSQRRPLNAVLFAVRLGVCGGRPDRALLMQAVLLALGLFLFAAAVARRYGVWAGIATLGALWSYGRLYAATTLSESLGLTLGAIACALLVCAIRHRDLALTGFGAMAMGLAMAARAGAMFLLPGLVLWAGWYFGPGWRRRAAAALVAAAGVVAAVGTNSVVLRIYGTGENIAGSNFAPTLCGMSIGGSWSDAYRVYRQELDQWTDEARQAAFLYQKAWENIRNKPEAFFEMMGKNLKAFARDLRPWLAGLTSLPGTPESSWQRSIARTNRWVWIIMLVAMPLSLWRFRRGGDWKLFAVNAAAMAASVPFLYLDGGFRVFAANWPLVVLVWTVGFASAQRPRWLTSPTVGRASMECVPVPTTTGKAMLGLQGVTTWFARTWNSCRTRWRRWGSIEKIAVSATLIVALLALIGPKLSYRLTAKPTEEMIDAARQRGEMLVRAWPYSSVVVVLGPGQSAPPGVPTVGIERFERLIARKIHEDIAALLPLPATPFVVTQVLNLVDRKPQLLVGPPGAIVSASGFVRVRVEPTTSPLYVRIISAVPAEATDRSQ